MLLNLIWQNSLQIKKNLKKYNLYFLNFYKSYYFFKLARFNYNCVRLTVNKSKVNHFFLKNQKIIFLNLFI